MADTFPMLDTEFVLWSPTYIDEGDNPTTTPPVGVTATFSTDHPEIFRLQFTSPDNGESPDLNPDGSQGTYIGSNGLGIASATVVGGGTAAGYPSESVTGEVKETAPKAFNMTLGTPKREGTPPPPQAARARR